LIGKKYAVLRTLNGKMGGCFQPGEGDLRNTIQGSRKIKISSEYTTRVGRLLLNKNGIHLTVAASGVG
jgi:hypothetical protein